MQSEMERSPKREENGNEIHEIRVDIGTHACRAGCNKERLHRMADIWFLIFGIPMMLCHFLEIQIFTKFFFDMVHINLSCIFIYTVFKFIANFGRAYSWLEMIIEATFLEVHIVMIIAYKGYVGKNVSSWKTPEIALAAVSSMMHLISVAQRLARRPELEYNRYNAMAYIPTIFMTCVTVLVCITDIEMNYIFYAYILSSAVLGIISLGSKDSVEKESSDNSNRYKMISSLCMGGLITISMIIATKKLDIIKFATE